MSIPGVDVVMPRGLMLPVFLGLIGVAFADSAPGTFPVETPAGPLALGDLTLPVALVVFGGMLSRAVDRLAGWRPHVIVEHRHVQPPPPSPPLS